jgi:hypothetical protein
MTRIAALVSSLFLGGCTVFGIRSGTPQPAYTVTGHIGAVELRRYGPRLAADITVPGGEIDARSAGFRALAGYIFGANTKAGGGSSTIEMTAPVEQARPEKVAMTAPVAQQKAGQDGWTIRFFLPAGLTLATAPWPRDPAIHLVEVAPEEMAVLRFSGIPGAAAVARERARLLAAVEASAWKAAGAPVAWFYDPPWTLPWLRRNEVAVDVERR